MDLLKLLAEAEDSIRVYRVEFRNYIAFGMTEPHNKDTMIDELLEEIKKVTNEDVTEDELTLIDVTDAFKGIRDPAFLTEVSFGYNRTIVRNAMTKGEILAPGETIDEEVLTRMQNALSANLLTKTFKELDFNLDKRAAVLNTPIEDLVDFEMNMSNKDEIAKYFTEREEAVKKAGGTSFKFKSKSAFIDYLMLEELGYMRINDEFSTTDYNVYMKSLLNVYND